MRHILNLLFSLKFAAGFNLSAGLQGVIDGHAIAFGNLAIGVALAVWAIVREKGKKASDA